jgi:hypothetical protein
MKDGKKHDVLFLFSMGNKAYAFDINTASNIWTTPLGHPFRPDPHGPVDSHHINTSFGVLSSALQAAAREQLGLHADTRKYFGAPLSSLQREDDLFMMLA